MTALFALMALAGAGLAALGAWDLLWLIEPPLPLRIYTGALWLPEQFLPGASLSDSVQAAILLNGIATRGGEQVGLGLILVALSLHGMRWRKAGP